MARRFFERDEYLELLIRDSIMSEPLASPIEVFESVRREFRKLTPKEFMQVFHKCVYLTNY